MKNLSVRLRTLLFLLVSLLVTTGSYANHILGMDLYYTWVTGNTYKITMVIYGDCSPASNSGGAFSALPTDQPQICIFRGNTNVGTISLNIEAPTHGVDITPVCASQVGLTQCENPNSTIPGIMKFVYSANYTLPAPTVSDAWQFAFFGQLGNGGNEAGRSVNITNIINPQTTLIQLIDTLNNSVYSNNSSAQYSVIPTPFFCLNQPDSYNPGAIAPVGDSLSVVDLIPAVDASGPGGGGPPQCRFGVPVTYTGTAWNPPFTPVSGTTPLNVAAGSFSYNVTTGQLNFTPNQVQRSTIVYNVREFKNGNFVGSSQREMNFLVQSCAHTPPAGGVSGITNGIIVDSAQITTCSNSGPFSFTFDPREPGSTNDITVSWTGLPVTAITPTITVTNNNTTTPHVVFAWTSTGVAPGTYIFYLTYTDNNCPLQGSNTTAISVTILPSGSVKYTVLSSITCSSKEAINVIPSGTGSPWTIKVTGDTSQTFVGVTGNFTDSLSPGIDTISIASSSASRCDTPAIVIIQSTKISGDTILCAGATITLSDAYAGGTWSSGNTAIATVVAAGTAAGNVTGVSGGRVAITYTFPGGCFKTDTITVKPLPSPIGGMLHACTGLTTTLSDALAGGTWSSGTSSVATVDSVSGVVTGVTAGVAIISYGDNGCFTSTSVTVNIQPTVGSGSPNICTDGTATLTATPGGGVWSTSNTSVATIITLNADSARIVGITTGITVVTYALSGCTTTKTVSAVSILPPITGPNKVCTGQSVVLSDIIVGGTWTSTNTSLATVDDSAGVVVGVSPGVPTISYTIGGSCVTSTTITVNQSPDHGAILGLSNVCIGYSVSLSDTISGGIWGVTNDSANITTGGVVTGISHGIDTVRYIVSNTNCTDTTTRPITIYAVPDSGTITGPSVMCTNATITLGDSAPGGTWSSVFTSVATVGSTAVVTSVAAGVDTIEYTVSNPGCSTIARHLVTVYNHPDSGFISGPMKVCEGAVFSVSDSTGGGVWSSSNTTVATMLASADSVYTHGVGITLIRYTTGPNAGQCIGTATYTVTVTSQNTLSINSTVTPVTCNGDNNGSIATSVSGGTAPVHFQYIWAPGGSTDSVITNLVPGPYVLHVTEPSTFCKATDTITVTQPDTLKVVADMEQDKCKQGNGSVTTTVSGGTQPYSYHWSDNSTAGTLDHLHAGTYTVTVTDLNGCTQTVISTVTDNDCIINIHNALTPNGDGYNDTWVIEGIDNYPSNTVQVFDKWGDIVYEKTNYNNDWDGKGKGGTLVPDGTYFYLIKLNAVNLLGSTKNEWTGSILIKR